MITRYDIYGHDYTFEESQHGDYVEYCDYSELEKKYEKLVKMVEELYREV